jgi:hypothetical protein
MHQVIGAIMHNQRLFAANHRIIDLIKQAELELALTALRIIPRSVLLFGFSEDHLLPL